MAITGTGTGPFTITGTETTLSIYNAVVAANAANATKNSDNSQFDFNCQLLVGDGTTVTSWGTSNEQIRIDASLFEIRVNATMTLGLASPARLGSSVRWQMTGNDQIRIYGTLNAYASSVYFSHRARGYTGTVVYFEECALALLDGIDNVNTNPNIQYVRCFVAGATAVGVKLGGAVSLSGTKVSGTTYAFQPLNASGTANIYTVNDYIGQGNTFDIVPNIAGTPAIQLNIVGAFDGGGNPRESLLLASNFTPVGTQRLQWRYDLNSVFEGANLQNANVRIQNVNGTTVYSGQTGVDGAIPQQILTRFEYINSRTGAPRFPYQVTVRKYDATSQTLAWQADNHTTQASVHTAISNLSLTEAQAAALTGMTLTPDLPPNQIANGGFDSATGWTIPSGSVSGGVANITNATMMVSQPSAAWTVGKTYSVSIDYTKSNTGGGFRIGLGSTDNQNAFWEQNVAAGSGTITTTFTAGVASGFYLGASGQLFTGTIDNVIVREVGAAINTGTVAVTGTVTASDLWHYYRQWIAQTANFDSEDTWTFDGTTINTGAWDVVVDTGATLTGNVTTTGTVTTTGEFVGSYTDANGTRVTIRASDNAPVSSFVIIDGVPQGWQSLQTARRIFVQPTSVVQVYAHAYGMQPRLITVNGNTASDYVISFVPEVHVDVTQTERDTIAAAFGIGVDGLSRIFLSVDTDLRDYTPQQVLHALHYFVLTQAGAVVGPAAIQAGDLNGFGLINGGFAIRTPGFYGKVADSVTTVSNLGILVPLAIYVDPAVYAAVPTYTPVEKNTSGIVLQYAPWTQLQADVNTAAVSGSVWTYPDRTLNGALFK